MARCGPQFWVLFSAKSQSGKHKQSNAHQRQGYRKRKRERENERISAETADYSRFAVLLLLAGKLAVAVSVVSATSCCCFDICGTDEAQSDKRTEQTHKMRCARFSICEMGASICHIKAI